MTNLVYIKGIFNIQNYLFLVYKKWFLYIKNPLCVIKYILLNKNINPVKCIFKRNVEYSSRYLSNLIYYILYYTKLSRFLLTHLFQKNLWGSDINE